ncbi:hypothetical protein GpartN1_g3519.t1 [Galdieria partita]|uniref:Uncharacterized protein n=1 Tax=Galdieria partita TaxID=83374 RepID=A0A9C7PVP3_9RHOD|nr:hypothetical protein GpartN1_g3519.t1 [Galdieria partita]
MTVNLIFIRPFIWNENKKLFITHQRIIGKRCTLHHSGTQGALCSIPGAYKRRFRFEQESAALRRQFTKNLRRNKGITNFSNNFEHDNMAEYAKELQGKNVRKDTGLKTSYLIDENPLPYSLEQQEAVHIISELHPYLSFSEASHPTDEVIPPQISSQVTDTDSVSSIRAVEVGKSRKDIEWASQKGVTKTSSYGSLKDKSRVPWPSVYVPSLKVRKHDNRSKDRFRFVSVVKGWLNLIVVRLLVYYLVGFFSKVSKANTWGEKKEGDKNLS